MLIGEISTIELYFSWKKSRHFCDSPWAGARGFYDKGNQQQTVGVTFSPHPSSRLDSRLDSFAASANVRSWMKHFKRSNAPWSGENLTDTLKNLQYLHLIWIISSNLRHRPSARVCPYSFIIMSPQILMTYSGWRQKQSSQLMLIKQARKNENTHENHEKPFYNCLMKSKKNLW